MSDGKDLCPVSKELIPVSKEYDVTEMSKCHQATPKQHNDSDSYDDFDCCYEREYRIRLRYFCNFFYVTRNLRMEQAINYITRVP